MSKAIIVELNKKHAIVLAEGGSFLRVPRKNSYQAIGQEVDASELIQQKQSGSSFFNWKTSVAAAAAALLLFFQFFYPFTGQEVYASVSMDMDPSIEIEINKDLNVVDILTYNEQGKDVLRSIKNWRGQSINVVTKKIFQISSAKGFIQPHQEVLIATTIAEDISTTEETAIKKHVSSLMQKEAKKQNLDMTSVLLSKKEKMKAEEYGISPGQYAILAAAKQKGHHMTANDVKNKSIRKISEEVGPVKNLFEDSESPVSKTKVSKQATALEAKESKKEKKAAPSNPTAKKETKQPSILSPDNNERDVITEPAHEVKKQREADASRGNGKETAQIKEKNKENATEKDLKKREQKTAISPAEEAGDIEEKKSKKNQELEPEPEKKATRSLPVIETAAVIEESEIPASPILPIEIKISVESDGIILSVEAVSEKAAVNEITVEEQAA